VGSELLAFTQVNGLARRDSFGDFGAALATTPGRPGCGWRP